MKATVIIVLLAVLFAIAAAQVENSEKPRRERPTKPKFGLAKRFKQLRGKFDEEKIRSFLKKLKEKRRRPAVEDDIEADLDLRRAAGNALAVVANGWNRATQGAQSMVPHIPTLLQWAAQLNGMRKDDEEEADKFNWDKAFEWFGKGKQIYDIVKNRDDFDEESDAEFFKKVGSFFKKNFTPENIQKGLSIYRTIKGGDDAEEVESDEASASQGQQAASFALAQVGKGYSQSARLGPNSFDCSGLVKVAWQRAGKTVPNTTRGYPGGLTRVSESQLRAGDILWRSGHVAMYVGGGQLVQAANPRKGVVKTPLSDYKKWWGGYTAIYRP